VEIQSFAYWYLESEMSIKDLEQVGALQALIILLKEGPLPLTALASRIDCSLMTLYNAIEKLLKAGLIVEEREEAFPRRRIFRLTEKGQKIAKKLLEVEEDMKSQ